LTIDRDWHMAWLCGTGSHTLVGADVWVPDSHGLGMAVMTGGPPNVAIALGLFAPLLGAARGAVDAVAAVIGQRSGPGPATTAWRNSPAPSSTSPKPPPRPRAGP
jgi:alkylation response protein AidB-like acyl-CoA dehydrogenase